MPAIELTGGAYQAKSVIANAQRCINLIPEVNPADSRSKMTHYPAPGKRPFSLGVSGVVRCLYRASNGALYGVVNQNVCTWSRAGVVTILGTMLDNLTTPAYMRDNGFVLILVDGTANGYAINLTGNTFAKITDPSFLGSDFVDFVDTFFLFNQPGTRNWYISLSEPAYNQFVSSGASTGTVTNGGSGWSMNAGLPVGIWPKQQLTGGTGAGAIADIYVKGVGFPLPTSVTVSDVKVTTQGSGYSPGDVLGVTLGGIISGSNITATGGGYGLGPYGSVAMLGGHGQNAVADVQLIGGVVVLVTFTNAGLNYQVGDVLTFPAGSLGGTGSGAAVTITAVTSQGSGLQYTLTSVPSEAFDPLDTAAKIGDSDLLLRVIVMHRDVWLIGEMTTEVWYNTGAGDFVFGIMPGIFVEHGAIAKYSIAAMDLNIFWLSRDKQGTAMVVKGEGYRAVRVSTHAIENTLKQYSTLSDAIGFCYQQEGHLFYVLSFPTANATWVFDVTSGQWHQRCSVDSDGNLNRDSVNLGTQAYEEIIVGDFKTGSLFVLDDTVYTDNGTPMTFIRSFPVLANEQKRVAHQSLILDMEVGNEQLDDVAAIPQVSLSVSDDSGRTFAYTRTKPMGAPGQYRKSIKFTRLGMARNRVYEVMWSADVKTALNGAYIEVAGASS